MSPPARQSVAQISKELGIHIATLQRWRRQFVGGRDGTDRRKGSLRYVAHRLSDEERQRILLTCNEPEFAVLPPGQIVQCWLVGHCLLILSAASTVVCANGSAKGACSH
jgi:hypothetical protein